jgi:hypothetical protein
VVYRVVQWYTGSVGKQQLRLIAAHPELELVGVVVHDEAKDGRDAGELAGIEHMGVRATTDVEQALHLQADCALYNAPYEHYEEIVPLLANGVNVISTVAGFYPKLRPEYDEILDACEHGAATLAGAGVHPGFQGDYLPLLATSVCGHVEHVHIREWANLAGYEPFTLTEVMGFGRALGDLERDSTYLNYMTGGYRQMAALVADGIGVDWGGVESDFEFAAATQDCLAGGVKTGTVAGIRLRSAAIAQAGPLVTVDTIWYVDPALGGDWVRGEDEPDFVIDVRGQPDCTIAISLSSRDAKRSAGAQAAAARMVNAIPDVCEAAPGILTALNARLPRHWGYMRPAAAAPKS